MGRKTKYLVWERDDWHCRYCGQMVFYDHPRRGSTKPLSNLATVDHLIPKSQGGGATLANLVTACWSCNHDRGNLSVHDFVMGNPDSHHAMRASRRLRQRIDLFGDLQYALSVPFEDAVLTPYDDDDTLDL